MIRHDEFFGENTVDIKNKPDFGHTECQNQKPDSGVKRISTDKKPRLQGINQYKQQKAVRKGSSESKQRKSNHRELFVWAKMVAAKTEQNAGEVPAR